MKDVDARRRALLCTVDHVTGNRSSLDLPRIAGGHRDTQSHSVALSAISGTESKFDESVFDSLATRICPSERMSDA